MKYICYQKTFAIHGLRVYWVSGWEMRRLTKKLSEIIVFKNKLLLVSTYFTLLDAFIESLNALLVGFQELHLDW